MPVSPPPTLPDDPVALADLSRRFATHARMIRVRTRGRLGEIMAAVVFPRTRRDGVLYDQKTFPTPYGLRRLDNFLPAPAGDSSGGEALAGGEALEAKMTFVVASRRIRTQIAKDAYLLRQGVVRRVTWVLYKGGSRRLKALLAANRIAIIDGWENLHAADDAPDPC